VCLYNIFWNTFHTKYFDLKAGSIRQRVFNRCQCFFVNLVHVNGEACCCQYGRLVHWIGFYLPPAVFSLRPHLSHLKCLAFWWEIRIFKSSKSRSPAMVLVAVRKKGLGQCWTYSNNTRDVRAAPRYLDDCAFSCPPFWRYNAKTTSGWDVYYEVDEDGRRAWRCHKVKVLKVLPIRLD